MIIREYKSDDCGRIEKLFYETVHTVNAADYTEKQLDAWAPANLDPERWNAAFSGRLCLVAEEDGEILGFGDIDAERGYLDRLYTGKNSQRRGIATLLCDRLEAAVAGDTIITHASITAKPFFKKRGYVTVKEQTVICHGVPLNNFVMKKVVITDH